MTTQPHDSEHVASSPSGSRPARLRAELLVTYGLSVALTGGLGLLQDALPAFGAYLYLGVVAVFLLLPTLVVRSWRGEDPVSAGMCYGALGRGVSWGVGLALLTAVPFLAGFHVWTTYVQGQAPAHAWSNYYRWPDALEGRAETPDHRPGVDIWSEGPLLRIWWRTPERAPVTLRLAVEGSGELEVATLGRGLQVERSGAGAATIRPAAAMAGSGVDVWVRDGTGALSVESLQRGVPVPPDAVRLRGAPAASNPLVLERGWFWILNLLLTQLILVGLPEEYFYRGYVQPTLARLTGDRAWGRGPWGLSLAVVGASVLFALGHLLVEWHLARLAVFFPSLVFGWLRERTGGLTAPLVYHGLCNAMVELAAVHYLP